MADLDDLALLMPRSLGGRRLSSIAADDQSLRAYQAAMKPRTAPAIAEEDEGEEAPMQPVGRLALLRRREGSGRSGAGAKHLFVFKPWTTQRAPAPPKAALRAEKTPKRSPAARGERRVSFAASAEENTPPPSSVSARAEVGKASRSSSGGAAARAPPPAPLFEDASPDAQAFLAAARARLQGLARPEGSAGRRGGSGSEPRATAFELAMPPAPPHPPAASSRWAEQLEPSPEAAAAAAAAARRRGAPAARPVLLSYTPSPVGRAGVAPAPLAPTPRLLGALSPTPTPTASQSPFDGAPGSERRRSARGGAAVEMQTQTTPALAAAARGRGGEVQDMACGTTPQASVEPEEQAAGGDGGADEWAGDDGAAGWGCDADEGCEDAAPAPAAVSRSKRATGPPGTPNKRLKAAFRGRKSLAWAGTQLEEGSGVRRSTRAHLRPLEYWRNETKAYGRQHQSLPTVASVTLRSPEPQWPAPAGWKPPRGGKPDGKHPAHKAKTQARTRRAQHSEEECSDCDSD